MQVFWSSEILSMCCWQMATPYILYKYIGLILNAHLMSWTIVTNKIKDKDVGQKKIKLKDQWFKYTCIYFSRICNTARRALFFLIFPWCMVTNFDLQKLFLLRYSTCSCRTEEQFLEGPQTSIIDRKAYNAPDKTDKYSWGYYLIRDSERPLSV